MRQRNSQIIASQLGELALCVFLAATALYLAIHISIWSYHGLGVLP